MNAKVSAITDILTYNTYDHDLVDLWDKVCEKNNYPDDMIYTMDDFEELCGSIAHNEGLISLIDKVQYGEFNTGDSWFWFNGYGNLYSCDNPATDGNCPLDMDMIVEYLEQEGDADGVIDRDDLVQGFLDEFFILDEKAERILNELINDEEVDLLADDWYDVRNTIESLLEENDDEDDDEDEDE